MCVVEPSTETVAPDTPDAVVPTAFTVNALPLAELLAKLVGPFSTLKLTDNSNVDVGGAEALMLKVTSEPVCLPWICSKSTCA